MDFKWDRHSKGEYGCELENGLYLRVWDYRWVEGARPDWGCRIWDGDDVLYESMYSYQAMKEAKWVAEQYATLHEMRNYESDLFIRLVRAEDGTEVYWCNSYLGKPCTRKETRRLVAHIMESDRYDSVLRFWLKHMPNESELVIRVRPEDCPTENEKGEIVA